VRSAPRRSKPRSRPPCAPAREHVFDVHFSVTVRGAGPADELDVEELITGIVDQQIGETYGQKITLTDAENFDVRYYGPGPEDGGPR
jgi:hypothetical protein